MIIDALTKIADSLAVTDTDAYTTYSVDLGNVTPKRAVGAGEPLALVFIPMVAAAGSTDTTDLIQVTSANATLSSHIELLSWRVANASLTAGSIFVMPFPSGANLYRRYIGGRVELGSGDTITVDAYILPLSDALKLETYADNVTYDA
jgi:hypothetical protein